MGSHVKQLRLSTPLVISTGRAVVTIESLKILCMFGSGSM